MFLSSLVKPAMSQLFQVWFNGWPGCCWGIPINSRGSSLRIIWINTINNAIKVEIAKRRRRSGTVLSLELNTVHSFDSLNTASYSSASAVPELIQCVVVLLLANSRKKYAKSGMEYRWKGKELWQSFLGRNERKDQQTAAAKFLISASLNFFHILPPIEFLKNLVIQAVGNSMFLDWICFGDPKWSGDFVKYLLTRGFKLYVSGYLVFFVAPLIDPFI